MRAAMPDIIDPQRPCLLRLHLRIDPRRLQALSENRINQSEIGADTAVERIVPRCDVIMPPAQLPCIRCEDAGGEAAFVGAGEEGDGEFVVVGHVELEKTGTVAVGCGNGFDGAAAGGREAVGEVELFGDGGDGELAGGVVYFVYADGGETDGGGDCEGVRGEG